MLNGGDGVGVADGQDGVPMLVALLRGQLLLQSLVELLQQKQDRRLKPSSELMPTGLTELNQQART